MTTGYIVFARMDSRRLPGKALKDLVGMPMLARVLRRVRAAADGRPTIVATSDRSLDDPIADLASSVDAGVFRGATDDVAGRALACADTNRLDRFVRICGDSPFIDPFLCRRMVEIAETDAVDVVTNLHPRTFPPGCSVEVVATGAMRRVCEQTAVPAHREHVTTWIYEHADAFSITNVASESQLPPMRLTVDTEGELARARRIYAAAGNTIDSMTVSDIVALALRLDSCEGVAT